MTSGSQRAGSVHHLSVKQLGQNPHEVSHPGMKHPEVKHPEVLLLRVKHPGMNHSEVGHQVGGYRRQTKKLGQHASLVSNATLTQEPHWTLKLGAVQTMGQEWTEKLRGAVRHGPLCWRSQNLRMAPQAVQDPPAETCSTGDSDW